MLRKSDPTPGEPRDTYHHGDLRAALIRAGIDLVSRCGSRGFTMAQAAKIAAVAASAPYRHFKDRDELLAAIAEEGFIRLAARFASIGAGDDRLDRRRRGTRHGDGCDLAAGGSVRPRCQRPVPTNT